MASADGTYGRPRTKTFVTGCSWAAQKLPIVSVEQLCSAQV